MTQVTATDADDPTYGNSARVVYSILHGQPYFSVDPKTGERTAFLQAQVVQAIILQWQSPSDSVDIDHAN